MTLDIDTQPGTLDGSALRRKLADRQFVITTEITPPVTTNPKHLLELALPMRGLADAVNVTDGAGARTHLDALVSSLLLKQNAIEPVLQITCRDRNRIALQSEMLGAAALGITNLLILRGDDPKQGDQPDAKPVFDLDAPGLTAMAARMRDDGVLPTGRKISGRVPFLLGVADTPMDPELGGNPDNLLRKIAAGAQFAQTQFCMDTGVLRRYFEMLAQHRETRGFHVLVGLSPLGSARSALWMRRRLPGTIIPDWIIERLAAAQDAQAEGIAICVDIMRELSGLPMVAGAHLMAPSNPSALPATIRAWKNLAR